VNKQKHIKLMFFTSATGEEIEKQMGIDQKIESG
jgi:hypothetical protein